MSDLPSASAAINLPEPPATPPKKRANLRKRGETDQSEVTTSSKEARPENIACDVAARRSAASIENLAVTYQAKAATDRDKKDTAVSMAEYDTAPDRDHKAIREAAMKISAETAGQVDNIYRGRNNYKAYLDRQDTSRGNASSDKIRAAGPVRAAANLRVTCRFDYAPDLCKDYNETGFCGFGDSCKFAHDRGDYKSGWELDAEWEAKHGQLQEDPDKYVIHEEKAMLPEACPICYLEFTDPVSTKCGHYFCEKCALKYFAKRHKCFVCGATIAGQFQVAKDLLKQIEKQRANATSLA